MSNSYNEREVFTSTELTLEGATDLEMPFTFLNDVVIHKIGLHVSNTAAGGATVTFEDRTGASTDTTIEVVVIPAANNDGNTLYTEIAAGYVLQAGHILNLAVVEGATAPTAYAIVEYSHLDVALARRALLVVSA
jgi:hypothetical protein